MRLNSFQPRTLVPAAILAFVSACADTPPTAPPVAAAKPTTALWSSARSGGNRRADHALIELKGAARADFDASVAKLGGRVERKLSQLNFAIVRGLSDSAMAVLSSRSDVASVTPDVRIRWIPERSSDPSTRKANKKLPPDPVDQSGAALFPFQWNIRQVKADQAWGITPAGRGASVYVLDTGIDPDHIDLAGVVDLSRSRSFSEVEPEILDFNAHGTFVSAIVASNGIGVASVAPRAKIVAVKVLDFTGTGSFADLIEGIIYAADQRADVINLSLGAYVDLGDPADRRLVAHLQLAIAYARLRGSVVVAAAGNGDLNFVGINLLELPRNIIDIPAELFGVISVGATGPVDQVDFDQLASYSNYGWKKSLAGGVQVFAPGGGVDGSTFFDLVFSACSGYTVNPDLADCAGTHNSYAVNAGTSLAAPMVSAEAAVLRSILGSSTKDSFENVECILGSTDKIGPSSIFGHGRINVVKGAKCASKNNKGKGFAN